MATGPDAEARRIVESLLEKIEFLREEAKERRERFEALSKEQLLERVARKPSKSPYFYAQSWGSASPGGSTSYTAYVHNPDPFGYSGYWLLGYLFFGPANFISDPDIAMTSVDTRFPNYNGRFTVAAGSDTHTTFTIHVPSSLAPGIYIGNCFLVRRDSFDVGTYVDRAAFDLTVS